ncbi:3-hydroxyacyl-CoA dehydrogenase NAD-binding domain-containing protein [Streptomyces sp. B1866]|uniref:3-hydroxyacyl-CoA dehydrogenase family protein n=1 Tax=Streptomyces sp. B1866 TaxID=3075431 RepID=UPI00288F4FFB|nr:3-hydroxyacyl-CoA dehydrogenase NAD-binding domain-containing protein [Streptomyces sp. B1866]MDT3399567.1 3-hydroxyacyl-CoA dehydrogenase NAD-binding domain-containing protein [Streptomyces sp. B1866]
MAERFAHVAVIGVGAVGSLWVGLLARHGLRVTAVEADEDRLERARARVAGLGSRTADGDGPDGAGDRGPADGGAVRWTTRPADAADADLVIEAVPERAAAKAEVLGAAVAACGADTVFATTTTGYAVARLASLIGAPTRTVGLHLFPSGPAGAVEVAGTPLTDAPVREAVLALAGGLGLAPVAVHDRPGFVGGALTLAYLNSAVTMYEQGYASRDDIDTAMRLGCGLPSGPLAHLDAIGLDVARDTLQALYERTGERDYAPAPLLSHYVAAGLLGRKSGRGFYDYQDGRRDAGPAAGAAGQPGAGLPRRPVGAVGVVGSGTMGAGIAEVCARAGLTTVLVARTEARAKEALGAVERSLSRGVKRGRLTAEDREAALARLTGAAQPEALGGSDLVIEAVAEDLGVKRELFARLGAVCRPGAVLATSTSSLPVVECATASGRPGDVVGLHFFNPAPVMRLVEVVRTALTSDDAVGTAYAAARALGKSPVGCFDRAGFIVNALLFPYLNRAVGLVGGQSVAADDVDAVMVRGLGYPMGPLALLDVVGLDVSLQIQRTLHDTFREPSLAPAPSLEHLVAAGHLGRKTGRGFRVHAAR